METINLLSKASASSNASPARQPDRQIQSQMSLETAKQMNISGNPSEVALLRHAAQFTDVLLLRDRFQVVFEIPFNSSRKWHLVITKQTDNPTIDGNTSFTLMIKGAPEVLIDLCTHLATESGDQPLNADLKLDFKVSIDLID
jgi:magnesium-transporting ATPase (P-type)